MSGGTALPKPITQANCSDERMTKTKEKDKRQKLPLRKKPDAKRPKRTGPM
jgi:hypothetical protein